MTSDSNFEALEADYNRISPLAQRLVDAIEAEMPSLLERYGVSLGVPIEKRVKDWASLKNKAEEKERSSIETIRDFAGMRFIVLFQRDLAALNSLIIENFDSEEVEDVATRLDTSQFGYQSTHYIVKLKPTWLGVPRYADLGALNVEFQVRTLAQHIWAAASHKLQYKQEAGVPPPLRRTISRVSALLETVDLELSRVLSEREIYVAELNNTVAQTKLNVTNLEQVLAEILPLANKGKNERYDQLLIELSLLGISDVDQLKNFINGNREAIVEGEKQQLEVHSTKERLAKRDPERIAAGVFYTHTGLVRVALKANYDKDAIKEIMDQRREKMSSD